MSDIRCTIEGSEPYKNYTFILNNASVVQNSNKFYYCEVITIRGEFYVFSRYGRVGETGIYANKIFKNEFLAIKEFIKRFKIKTGNEWGNQFVSIQGKYVLMDILPPKIEEEEIIHSDEKLEENVEDFIKIISDKGCVQSTMKYFNMDAKQLPLGKISKTQIDKAGIILKEIEECINENSNTTFQSSTFWTLIPYSHGRKKPPIIDTHDAVKLYVDFLEVLTNLEVTSRIVKLKSTPFSIYEKLDIKMNILEEGDEFNLIKNYVSNSHGQTHRYKLILTRVFKISNQQNLDDFNKLENHKLLFHGSRTANFVGILQEGLRIPKPTQVMNGAALGFGIYFANSITKSFNYTLNNNDNTGFVLLCDVALGKNPQIVQQALFDHKPTEEYTSRIAKGQYDFVNDIDGIPVGELKHLRYDSGFIYNEYTVYDTNHYRFRYILELKKV